jgi:hypothetical protein
MTVTVCPYSACVRTCESSQTRDSVVARFLLQTIGWTGFVSDGRSIERSRSGAFQSVATETSIAALPPGRSAALAGATRKQASAMTTAMRIPA